MTEEQIDTCVELAYKILDKLGYVVFVKVQSMRNNELSPRPCLMCGAIGEPPLYLLAYRAKLVKPITIDAPEIAFEIDNVYSIGTSIRVDKGAAELPALNLRAALPNLLDLDVLMSLSDKWAADHKCTWSDAGGADTAGRMEFLSRVTKQTTGLSMFALGTTRHEARLAVWLKVIERNV